MDLATQLMMMAVLVHNSLSVEQTDMFSKVVYKIDDHKYKVESTNTDGKLDRIQYYKSLDAMPDDLGDKVKQLMWTSTTDQSITEELGVRIGDNIFWII